MASLDSVEPELLYIILAYVLESSPASALPIALTNSYLNAAAKKVIHNKKSLRLHRTNAEFVQLCKAWSESDDVSKGLHHLTITGSLRNVFAEYQWTDQDTDWKQPSYKAVFGTEAAYQEAWQPLADLLTRLKNLKTLLWAAVAPFPLNVLNVLQNNHPRATLQLFLYERFDPTSDHLDLTEQALSVATNLTHLKAVFRAPKPFEQASDYRLHAFRRIVCSAPNLWYAGLVVSPHAFRQLQRVDPGDSFLPSHSPNTSIRMLTLDGPPVGLSDGSLQAWAAVCDLSRLEILKFTRSRPDQEFFQQAPRLLPNVKHVSLNFSTPIWPPSSVDKDAKAANEYLRSCNPLELLSLWEWEGVITLREIIERHGSALKSLQLHSKGQMHDEQSARPQPDVEELEKLKTDCKSLKELTIDLNLSEPLRPDSDLSIMASMQHRALLSEIAPRLQLLQLYLNHQTPETLCGGSGDTEVSQAVVDQTLSSFVTKLWQCFYGRADRYGPRALDVKFGDWESRWIETRYYCMVRPHERDDRPEECTVSIKRRTT